MPTITGESLLGGEETYRLIVDLAEEGVWILNDEDIVVFTNEKLRSMLGYSNDELLDHSIYDFFDEDNKKVIKAALDRRRTGVKEIYTVQVNKKDLSKVWVVMAAAPVKDKQGKYLGSVGLSSDITGLKEVEETLRKEKSLANMYLDLMAHDINNFNQVAIGNLELGIERLESAGQADNETFDLLKKSLDTMRRCSQIIDNVKTIRRLKVEHLIYEIVDIDEMISEAAKAYSNIPGKKISLNYLPAKGCVVKANKLLGEVFVNLIGNAVKHSKGPVSIWINVDCIMENGKEYYKISVADDGPGIPDETKQQLFQRFKSGDRKLFWYGLGLFLVKTIVEDFHGKVLIEDRVAGDHSKGARFVVTLPAAEK